MAAKINIVMDQGAYFNTSFTIVGDDDMPVDFTNYTANSQMRKTYTSSTSYAFQVVCSNLGVINLSMSAATTNTISAGRYVYDVEVEDSDNIRSRIVEGIVTVTPQVTR
jgi:hypothetical protein